MNGLKKIRGRDNPTKRAGTIIQGIVKTQLEVVEVESSPLFPHICSLHCALTVEFTRMK